ncbi:DUF3996 domain-containing protein [Entomospira nematocerorum]|uniref:DUF3996 domain-containing protein n=1 Tax=Entomospira nematocerorum TaxID=2719987 RepID=A0A968GGR8_9SPIO|nr:DUF3996 domain-containing protein [Entomospira nematocera]NIZ46851.1 DUF3996 domain-containing protein [Entomospira nematocera]WDI33350.1 DUF3996 domain-containing protein [Entomospira nematocera]
MKKVLLILIFTFVGLSAAQARVGLGIVWGGSAAWNGWRGNYGAGFSLAVGELERVNWEMALRFWGGNNYFNFNIDTAWHAYQYNLASFVGLYIGIGPYLGFQWDMIKYRGDDNRTYQRYSVDIGARVPIGFRFFFARHFEIWLGMVPNVGLLIDIANQAIGGTRFRVGGGIGGEIGFRFWI